MPRKGYRYTPAQRENLRRGHRGQKAWNRGTGGCRRGHATNLYVCGPSGIYVCLGCKRENGARYRTNNKKAILSRSRLARYGLSPHIFHALWDYQQGQCAICLTVFMQDEYRIDHDHVTGNVRGILCAGCNTALGLLKDSQALLSQAIAYLATPPLQQLPAEAFSLDADSPDFDQLPLPGVIGSLLV
jgi:hypothetical protein